MLSSLRGVVTEMERIRDRFGSDRYIVRYHKASEAAGIVLEVNAPNSTPWIGFRYKDAHWSFVERLLAQAPD